MTGQDAVVRQSVEQESVYMESKTTRETSFELLRIVAMCMIIALHYLSKGEVLVSLGANGAGEMNAAAIAAWIVEAMCLPAVNVYILISGYFGGKSSFRISKFMHLWRTVLFYSVSITLLLGLTGNLMTIYGRMTLGELSIYDWMNVIFPLVTEEYWFITAYVILYLLMPFLNAGVEKLERKMLRDLLIVLFVFFSVFKSFLPMKLPTDKNGYDVLWFICLYLLGGYWRKYGCKVFEKRICCICLYLVSAVGTVGVAFGLRYLNLKLGIAGAGELANHVYTYNHLFCLAAAIGLFGIFRGVRIRGKQISLWIGYFASCTMAVYLIHEQLYLRYLWPKWFDTKAQSGTWTFLPHMTATVICVFTVCILIEAIRRFVVQRVCDFAIKRIRK